MTVDLVSWLLEQIDWEEHRVGEAGPARLGWATYRGKDRSMDYTTAAAESGGQWVVDGVVTTPDSVLVVYDPAKQLAECAAKRRIIELHFTRSGTGGTWDTDPPAMCNECNALQPCDTVSLLALPYATRPGYREEWAD